MPHGDWPAVNCECAAHLVPPTDAAQLRVADGRTEMPAEAFGAAVRFEFG